MEPLFLYQATLLQNIDSQFFRYSFPRIPWKDRFVGIKGLRGVGKTTLLLQYLKYDLGENGKHLYVTLDHPYFYSNSLYDLAQSFYQQGGETLLVDEVHKMENWSSQIKIIYDSFPRLQMVFTSSSALDLYRGGADLSRRVLTYRLPGLSFREYLELFHHIGFPAISLPDLLHRHMDIANEINQLCRPLALFKKYLRNGYFPFSKLLAADSFDARLVQTLEVVLNEDLSYVEGYTAENIFKIKKLLGILADASPFTANITALADKLAIGRNTVKEYLHAMEAAGILNFLNREGKGISTLQKPDKIFLENTNFSHALKDQPEIGTIRETFVLNQLKNAGKAVFLPKDGDILVEDDRPYTFEIGGKNKSDGQVKGVPNGFVIADDIENGFSNKIPIFLFGFLY